MNGFREFRLSKEKFEKDTLHLNLRTQRVRGELSTYKYRDRDTRQIILYIPSLELTSYGANEEKAMEMMQFSLDNYFQYLIQLSAKKLQSELLELKWKKSTLKNKDFSNAVINMSGKIKNLNAVGNKVERVTLVAA